MDKNFILQSKVRCTIMPDENIAQNVNNAQHNTFLLPTYNSDRIIFPWTTLPGLVNS
jgi:hypothetical protein